ncbi:MAG: hypothetical protein ACOCUH_03180 [Bacteriovoracia bacterium]
MPSIFFPGKKINITLNASFSSTDPKSSMISSINTVLSAWDNQSASSNNGGNPFGGGGPRLLTPSFHSTTDGSQATKTVTLYVPMVEDTGEGARVTFAFSLMARNKYANIMTNRNNLQGRCVFEYELVKVK